MESCHRSLVRAKRGLPLFHRWSVVPRIAKEGSSPPIQYNRKKHEQFLLALFQNLPALERDAEALLSAAADRDKRVMIMCMNQVRGWDAPWTIVAPGLVD
jgi:hypothetical protein